FTTFASFATDAGWSNGTNVTAYIVCGAEAATAGTIRVANNGTAIGGASVTCPLNSGDQPAGANPPFMFKITFSTNKNQTYELQSQAGAANSAVVWRSVHFTY